VAKGALGTHTHKESRGKGNRLRKKSKDRRKNARKVYRGGNRVGGHERAGRCEERQIEKGRMEKKNDKALRKKGNGPPPPRKNKKNDLHTNGEGGRRGLIYYGGGSIGPNYGIQKIYHARGRLRRTPNGAGVG